MSADARDMSQTPTVRALALLRLPALDSLSDHQTSGLICVWCGSTLTTGTAVDLGTRRGGEVAIWPRACRRCTAEQAEAALRNHRGMCESCVDGAVPCETGSALCDLTREYRRPVALPAATTVTAWSELVDHQIRCPGCTPTSACDEGTRLTGIYMARKRADREAREAHR